MVHLSLFIVIGIHVMVISLEGETFPQANFANFSVVHMNLVC